MKKKEHNFHGHLVSEERFWELIEKASCLETLEKELFFEVGIDLNCPRFIEALKNESKKAFPLECLNQI